MVRGVRVNSFLNQGRVIMGNLLPQVWWSAIQWEDNEPGAQTVRPGAVGPVRELLGGANSPAALFQLLTLSRSLLADSGLGQSAAILPGRDAREGTAGRPPVEYCDEISQPSQKKRGGVRASRGVVNSPQQ